MLSHKYAYLSIILINLNNLTYDLEKFDTVQGKKTAKMTRRVKKMLPLMYTVHFN